MTTFTSRGGVRARVVGNNLLVRKDPDPEATAGGIIVPGLGNASLVGTGVVVAVGVLTSAKAEAGTPIPDIAPGDRVAFIRLLHKVDVNPQIKSVLDDDIMRIRASDVLLVFAEEDAPRLR